MKTARWAFLGLCGAACLASPALAQSDDDMRRALIGIWMMDPGTADPSESAYIREGRRVFERFGPDGRGVAAVYADSRCKAVRAAVKFGWTVADGFLVTTYEGGRIDYDRILRLDDRSFVFQPPHSDRQVTRLKTTTCNRPAG